MKYIIAVFILFFISACGLKPSLDDPKLSNVQLDLEKFLVGDLVAYGQFQDCLLYTSPSPRDLSTSRMPSSA